MKVDITIQLICFVINIALATGALIFFRKATKLKAHAERLASRISEQANALFTLHERTERIRTLRLRKREPVPECIKFDSIERARFIDANVIDMAKQLALGMRNDGLIKLDSISEKEDPFSNRTVLDMEISVQVLPPERI